MPWSVGEKAYATVYAPEGFIVALCSDGINHNIPNRANAAFIVKAYNEYEALSAVADFAKHGGNCHIRDAFATAKTKCSCGLANALVALAAVRKGATCH